MKFFIAAIVILALISTLCAWGTNESVKQIDAMLETLGEASPSEGRIPPNSVEVAKKLCYTCFGLAKKLLKSYYDVVIGAMTCSVDFYIL